MTTNEIIQAFQKVKTEDPKTYYLRNCPLTEKDITANLIDR